MVHSEDSNNVNSSLGAINEWSHLPFGFIKNIQQTLQPSHQAERLRRKRQAKQDQAPSRKKRMRQGWLTRAVENAIVVPLELSGLSTSQKPWPKKPQTECKVYQHKELEGLGIRTIQWDGVYVFIPFGFNWLIQSQGFYSNQETIRNYYCSSCRLTLWTRLGSPYGEPSR